MSTLSQPLIRRRSSTPSASPRPVGIWHRPPTQDLFHYFTGFISLCERAAKLGDTRGDVQPDYFCPECRDILGRRSDV